MTGGYRWADDPPWVHETTWEWKPLPGQRYPGDQDRRRHVDYRPVYQAGIRPVRPQETSADGQQPPPPMPVQPAARPPREEPAWNRPASPLPEQLRGSRIPRPRTEATTPPARPTAAPDDGGTVDEPRAAPSRPGSGWFDRPVAAPALAAGPATVEPSGPPDSTGESEPPPSAPSTAAATDDSTTDDSTTDGVAADSVPVDRSAAGPTTQAAGPDPEQVLTTYPWRLHPETLRELVDDPAELRDVRHRLTTKLKAADRDAVRARLLSLRAVASRILGDLTAALADGREALEYAEATGELRRTAIVQARLAHVLQWRGDFAEADRLFAEANSVELPDRLRATMHEHAGRSCYDQGRFIEACSHFEQALDLRKAEDEGLIARTEVALDAVLAQVTAKGWGPYPRSREEILHLHRPPVPSFSDYDQRWGYADAYGVLTIPPRYADAQPFHEGCAWVRRPESRTWELIDEIGGILIDGSSAYLGAGSFSDGLAWVSRETGGWFAIDRHNTVMFPGGFNDVRPFRRGIAAVRRGSWGAIDSTGRVVVQFRYRAFATALTGGRYVDGFTDEGLAIVDTGDRKGVVDRTGRLIVETVHPALVIHPVAFLIGDHAGRWGALDRHGDPLIDVVHASRGDVADEIDRLLADTRPVL